MLVTDNPVRDLGLVKFGQVVRFQYTLTNQSDEDVLVDKVRVSCSSCTVAMLSSMRIKAKSDATLKVNFTPGTLGKHKKHVDILYNKDKLLTVSFNAQSHE